MKFIGFLLSLQFLFLCVGLNVSHAFKLSPIEIFFTPDGNGTTQTIWVENDTKKASPLEIKAYTRTIDEFGKETRVETQDFAIFPEQLTLSPGQRRSIRLTWKGALDSGQGKHTGKIFKRKKQKTMQFEKSYRLHVKQIPVDVTPEPLKNPNERKVSLNFLYEYIASIYVTPSKAQANLDVEVLKKLPNSKVEVMVYNRGNKHSLLQHYKPIVHLPNSKEPIAIHDIGKELKKVNLLANSKRKITLNLPAGMEKTQLHIKMVEKNRADSL